MILSFIFALSFSGVAGATYPVHKGDSLYGIANKYRMGYQDLRSLNPHIKYPNQLYIGQSIVVRTPNKASDLIDYAKVLKTQTKYVYGADYSLAPYKADCSSWTKHIYAKFGVKLPRTSREQSYMGTSVSFKNMKKGDLMFFASNGKTISHVGIYMGNGQWISNLNTAKSVQTFSIWGPWTQQHFMWAQRVL